MNKLPLVILAIVCWIGTSGANTGPAYDGNWWHSSSKDQHTGFIAGYIDCAVYEGGDKSLANVSWNMLEPEITSYYQGSGPAILTPVASVIRKLGSEKEPPKSSDAGEKWPEKHGIFDGDYWRQSLPEHRVGFVSGFLACYRNLSKKTASFSKSEVAYVSEVSRWYGVKEDDPSEINEKRVDTKIADVLFRFKDAARSKRGTMKKN